VMRSETLSDPVWEQQTMMGPETLRDLLTEQKLDGDEVKDAVGSAEGAADCDEVGDAVGSGVGAVDGDGVGDAVGSAERAASRR
jgi:hypothetical protein